MGFFDDQQGVAVLKHGILSRYLPIYASKTGSTSIGRRVAYLDAYAGAGAYEDGVPGSPALAAKTAEALTFRRIQCFMIEQRYGHLYEHALQAKIDRLAEAHDAG